MKKALYGHPDSGTFWEKHCEAQLKLAGFEPISNWNSCFKHPRLKLVLLVYVDDFKLAGPKANLALGWKLISQRITLDTPHELDRCLGCDHVKSTRKLPHKGYLNTVTYRMKAQLQASLDTYASEIANVGYTLEKSKKSSKMPFLAEQGT